MLLLKQSLCVNDDEEFTRPDNFRLTAKIVPGVRLIEDQAEDQAAPVDGEPLSAEAMAVAKEMIQFLRREEYQLKKQRLLLEARVARG